MSVNYQSTSMVFDTLLSVVLDLRYEHIRQSREGDNGYHLAKRVDWKVSYTFQLPISVSMKD